VLNTSLDEIRTSPSLTFDLLPTSQKLALHIILPRRRDLNFIVLLVLKYLCYWGNFDWLVDW